MIYAKKVVPSPKYKNTTKCRGDVEFEYSNTRLFCDSALFFRDLDIIHAYGDVHVNQGDTINLFGDSLKYFGKKNLSKMAGNVRFRDQEYKLTTDSLDYDGDRSIGYYKNWAVITAINDDLRLTSVKGYYDSRNKTFYFKDSVHAQHPEYEVFSDTLEFRTESKSAHFHDSTIVYLDSGKTTVKCVKGIFFSEKEEIQLWNGAHLIDTARTIYADSLVYSQKTDIGEGFCNVNMYDSTENVQFFSDYMKKMQNNEKVILKDNARILQFGDTDTLFLRADTIYYSKDTLTDKATSIGENNVGIINGDMTVRCDSAWFSESDSIVKLYEEPIMWNDKSQMLADSIEADYYDKKFHEVRMYHNAMIVNEHEGDSIHYDQIKGKFMTAKMDSGKVKEVFIEYNAQTLYYVVKEDKDTAGVATKTLDGLNKIDCNEIIIYFKDGDINDIGFIDQPNGIYYPMDRIPAKDLFLKGFAWKIELKPPRELFE